MLAELIVGQERMQITPISTFKWAVSMIISITIPCIFNILSNIHFWKTYTMASSMYGIEKIFNPLPWDLYYVVIGILFCAFRYRKTITLKPNIGKRTSQYTIMLVLNTFVLAFFLLFYATFINGELASYIEHISRVRRYTYEQLFFLYALLPSGLFSMARIFIAYQATRFLFDKNIRAS